MNSNNNFQVAPHGMVIFAAFAFIIVVAVHMLGFRVVGAVKLGR